MLRDKSLIPLSHQHQRALALCVRIERASPIPEADLAAWEMEVARLFEQEIKIHFTAEEEVLFPPHASFLSWFRWLMIYAPNTRSFVTIAQKPSVGRSPNRICVLFRSGCPVTSAKKNVSFSSACSS